MPVSYLERYHDGDCSRVWAELLSLGGAIREPELIEDASAVARETMIRARYNVELLVSRLRELKYRFVYPAEVWNPPGPGRIAELDRFEGHYGLLPLSLRLWHEIVGSVNFMGTHPKLSAYYGKDWGGSERLGCYSDPLVVEPLTEEPWPLYIDHAEVEDDRQGPPYCFAIAPDAIHKANHSGGGSPEILLPNRAIDAVLMSRDWDGISFVSFLRASFRWGGFPGFAQRFLGQSFDAEKSRPEIDFLREGLKTI